MVRSLRRWLSVRLDDFPKEAKQLEGKYCKETAKRESTLDVELIIIHEDS